MSFNIGYSIYRGTASSALLIGEIDFLHIRPAESRTPHDTGSSMTTVLLPSFFVLGFAVCHRADSEVTGRRANFSSLSP